MSEDIQKFDPNVAGLTEMVEASKALVIKDADDKAGYELVHKARMDLKNARVSITKIGKKLREEADARRKAVFEEEKKLIAIIEPEEDRLKAMQDAADLEIEKRKRVASMPGRADRLNSVEATWSYDEVLGMDDNDFEYFFNTSHAAFLKRKEDALAAEKARQEAEAKAEAERKAEADRVERERQEAVLAAERKKIEDAKLAAEQEEARKAAALQAERDKFEADKREHEAKLAAEAAEKARAAELEKVKAQAAEDARIQAEADRKRAEEAAALQAAADKAARERDHKYQTFLAKHGVNEAPVGTFLIQQEGEAIVIYKKIDSIIL